MPTVTIKKEDLDVLIVASESYAHYLETINPRGAITEVIEELKRTIRRVNYVMDVQ